MSFGNLMGMSSKPSTPRAVLPWPPPGGTPGAARRNSSMISGLQLPRMGGGAGRRASAAGMSSVAMARRGTTVGVGGLTLPGQDIKLLPVWSKSPTSDTIARVTPRHMSAANQNEKDSDSLAEEGSPAPGKGFWHCVSRLVSNPSSPKRIAYEMLGLLLIMYDLIWLPMQVFEPAEGSFFFVVGLVSSLYWTFDMPTSFLVGYAVQDKGPSTKQGIGHESSRCACERSRGTTSAAGLFWTSPL